MSSHTPLHKLSHEQVRQILETWPVGVLSTYAEHHIDSVPIVFVMIDGKLYSPIDGKPKSGRELGRLRNLRRDPRYTLLLQHYADDWQTLWWLRLTGTAEVLDNVDMDSGVTKQVAAALQAKYPQYQHIDVLSDARQMICMRIDTSRHWGQFTFP